MNNTFHNKTTKHIFALCICFLFFLNVSLNTLYTRTIMEFFWIMVPYCFMGLRFFFHVYNGYRKVKKRLIFNPVLPMTAYRRLLQKSLLNILKSIIFSNHFLQLFLPLFLSICGHHRCPVTEVPFEVGIYKIFVLTHCASS